MQAGSGLLLIALGAFALTVRPRSRATVAFGVFAAASGWVYAIGNIVGYYAISLPFHVEWLLTPARIANPVAVLVLALVFPHPLERRERWMLLPAAAVLLALAIPMGQRLAAVGWPHGGIAFISSWFALVPFGILLALRFLHEPHEARRRRLALVAAGPLVVSAWPTGVAVLHLPVWQGEWIGIVLLLTHLAIAAMYLAATRGPASRVARNMALLVLGAALFSAAQVAAGIIPLVGFARIVMVVLLGYAILRHRALGVDVRLRFAISKSTLAAVFIAVFFLASEGTQLLFGGENEWAGLAAAGALVFALAPLQRAADRLAERAIPLAPAAGAADVEADYRAAVRLALRDRVLSKDEERALLRLAERAGIPASRALAIHEEMERAVGA